MSCQIYFPNDLTRRRFKNGSFYMVGFCLENVYIIVQLVSELEEITKMAESAHTDTPYLVGGFNRKVPEEEYSNLRKNGGFPRDSSASNNSNSPFETPPKLVHLEYGYNDKLPRLISDMGPSSFVLFNPPNFLNLEYLSVDPISLQLTGKRTLKTLDRDLLNKFYELSPLEIAPKGLTISDVAVLDKINRCLVTRRNISKRRAARGPVFLSAGLNTLKKHIFTLLLWLAYILQATSISLIQVLNYEVQNHSLVGLFETAKQADLRLRQINYFPIQFLCYYDKRILFNTNSSFLKELQLPIFNADLNVNNLNYINLYNLLWLIFNDVLIGVTIHSVMSGHFDTIKTFVNDYIIQKLLFEDLYSLIYWVSFKHPAGFKLNNELGQFMGDLFLWSLKFWKFLIADIFMITLPSRLVHPLEPNYSYILQMTSFANFGMPNLLVVLLKVLCYLGFTFLLSFLVDYVKIITFHIHCFYYTSSKIYFRQIEVMKSLFQLFRGRKYNTLRDRIDSIDNEGALEVDQLLLGTVLFMILVYLLPTTFAFYLMFSIVNLMILNVFNIVQLALAFINFTPLFVILLKFKNSSRLQGGVLLLYLSSDGDVNYLRLTNKSLSYGEIFRNFRRLFEPNSERIFSVQVLVRFFKGDVIALRSFDQMKFNYLMLPKNFAKTVDIWGKIEKVGETK